MPVPRIILEANLWKDPEIRYATSGVAVADLPLVASTSHKEGDNWVTDHELWVYGKAFGEWAERAAELEKGESLIVTGRLVTEQWEDKSGAKQSRTRLLVDSFTVRGRSPKPKPQGHTAPTPAAEDPWGAASTEPPF